MPKYSQYNVPTINECVDFGVGQPDTRRLPLDFFKRTLSHYGKNLQEAEVLQYGQVSGYNSFKKSLAGWLNKKNYSNHQVEPNELFIVNGVTGGLQLLVNQYLAQDDIILVEEPSYFIAVNIFKEYGLTIETIPMKKDGLDLEILEEKVRKYCNIQKNIFLYTVPTCHNPTGYTLTDSKRKSLAAIAAVYNNFYVIADEVYHFLRWNNSEKILPLSDYHPNFISVGSFSKLLAPSLRVGWIYTNLTHQNKTDESSVIDDLSNNAVFDSSGGINVLGSMIVHQAIDTGFLDQYIKESQELLKSRCMSIVNKLKQQNIFEYEVPLGGYFIWLKSKYNTAQVLKTAENYKIKYHNGTKFSSHNQMKEYLRLSFSYYNSEDLEVGIDRLVSCYKDYQKVKVAIMGSKGKLGSAIVNLLSQKPYSDKYMVVFEIGRNSFTKTDTYKKLRFADIILDISSAEGTMQLIKYLNNINLYIPILSGTTGHSHENLKVMTEYGQKSPIRSIHNFSEGIPVLKNMIKVVNSLPSDWKVKIIETHHFHKKDSPSGTAKLLQSLIEKECIIESIREGENYGNHRIICSNDYETIEFTHQALNRNLFAKGCLDMINNVLSSSGFVTDLNLKTNVKDSSDEFVYSAHGNILKVIENFEGNKKIHVLQETKKNKKLDGIIFIENVNEKTCTCDWEYYNRDGDEGDFCGNGVRCIMKYVYDKYGIEYLNIEYKSVDILDDNIFHVRYNKGDIMVQSPDHNDDEEFTHVMQSMLETECEKLEIEVIDMELHHVSVPNLIIELQEDVFEKRDLLDILGNILNEYYVENFDENGVNINFVNLNTDDDNKHSISVVTWKRGVNRITESCCFGSLASYHYYLNDNTIKNHQADVEIKLLNNRKLYIKEESYIVYLTGPVDYYKEKSSPKLKSYQEPEFI